MSTDEIARCNVESGEDWESTEKRWDVRCYLERDEFPLHTIRQTTKVKAEYFLTVKSLVSFVAFVQLVSLLPRRVLLVSCVVSFFALYIGGTAIFAWGILFKSISERCLCRESI